MAPQSPDDVRVALTELADGIAAGRPPVLLLEEVSVAGEPRPAASPNALPAVAALLEEQRHREEEQRRIRDAEREQQLTKCNSKVRCKREGRAAAKRHRQNE
eukprot:gene23012-41174_t